MKFERIASRTARALVGCVVVVGCLAPIEGRADWPQLAVSAASPQQRSVAVGDLDGDGLNDVVATTRQGLVWYRNLGDGGFEPVDLVPGGPLDSALVDVGNDADLDIVVTWADGLSWVENLGGGTFGAVQVIDTGIDLTKLLAVDLDVDGDLDVVGTSYTSDTVFLYENVGGVLSSASPLSGVVASAYRVAVADLDEDLDLDLVVGSVFEREIFWFENIGDLTYAPAALLANRTDPFDTMGIALGDVDGDTLPDLLVGSSDTTGVLLFRNLGGGVFASAEDAYAGSVSCHTIDLGDYDGDSDLDLLCPTDVLENLGGGTFAYLEPLPCGYLTTQLVDLDGVGSDDLLHIQSNAIAWQPGLGAGVYDSCRSVSFHTYGVLAALLWDFDEDGLDDLVTATSRFDEIIWRRNLDGTGFAPPARLAFAPSTVSALRTADLSGDGRLDLVAGSTNDGAVFWYENLGTGALGGAQTLFSGATGFVDFQCADIDGVGGVDVVASHWDAGFQNAVFWHENSGAGVFVAEQLIQTGLPGGARFVLDDLSGDGQPDLIYVTEVNSAGAEAWMVNLGAGSFGAPTALSHPGAAYARYVWTDDFDDDGDPDVLVSTRNSAYTYIDLYWYENTGGALGAYQHLLATGGVGYLLAEDLTGDCALDAVSTVNGDTSVWPRSGGVYASPIAIDSVYGGSLPSFGDLDGDGDLDLLHLMSGGSLRASLNPEPTRDADGDGWFVCAGDCDDTEPLSWEGNPEVCDGIDNDCDTLVDQGLPDADSDGTCDLIDVCPTDPLDDSDNDGVCDTTDLCIGFDDNEDIDLDSIPDGCDLCFGIDATGDSNSDGICDDPGPCYGNNSDSDPGNDDTDLDGIADLCDPCPFDNPDDSDGDGTCDIDDLCPGFDDTVDTDGDGSPDGCDLCTGDDAFGDADGDGLCEDGTDLCFGDDAWGDADADGYCPYGASGVVDCDDDRPEVHPGAPEVCDGLDNDCDGYAWQEDTIGLSPSPEPGLVTSGLAGNLFRADKSVEFIFLSVYLELPASPDYEWVVYEATSQAGPYDLVYSKADNLLMLPQPEWYGHILDVTLHAGRYYFIGLRLPAGTVVYDVADTTPYVVTFGEALAGASMDVATPPSQATFTTTGALMHMELSSDPESDADTDGWRSCDGDCDDDYYWAHPGAFEYCDGADNDCNLLVDDGPPDADGDGVCDDIDPCPADNPDDADGDGVCDSVDLCFGDNTAGDADGDGLCEDGTDLCLGQDASGDLDGDGYCALAVDATVVDCDDTDPFVSPGQVERCNGLDDDCDGSFDVFEVWGSWVGSERLTADGLRLNLVEVQTDTLLDEFRVALEAPTGSPIAWVVYEQRLSGEFVQVARTDSVSTTDAPEWYTSGSLDLNLRAGVTYALGVGLEQGVRLFRESTANQTTFATFGGEVIGAMAVGAPDPTEPLFTRVSYNYWSRIITIPETDGDGDGVMICGGDCDDDDGAVFPGAAEVCDGLDNDCSGSVDAVERDADLDGVMICAGDCDDFDATAFPGATEVCGDGIDNDCDGSPTTDEVDLDGDGYAPCDGDCAPLDPAAHPGATEVCNGVDDDCDTLVDNGTPDSDGDGVCDALDACVGTNASGDSDGDGVCDSDDLCLGNDVTGDPDSDGICTDLDVCPAGDDAVDGDGDGVADACDPCPLDNPDDSDRDGTCDAVDLCPGAPDFADVDGDGTPDGCDLCDGTDSLGDADSDGVCDDRDLCLGNDAFGDTDSDGWCGDIDWCPGGDDNLDADSDSTPDACDPCPYDNPDDTDGDGVCDTDDLCLGQDSYGDADSDGICDAPEPCPGADADGDGVCDGVDLCFGNDALGDADTDGICDDLDVCPAGDDAADRDGDGVADACDACPDDDPDDSDHDGVCDSVDACHGYPDFADKDADGVADGCDLCTGSDSSGDSDGDGVCDDLDACTGDDAYGDPDADGICGDLDACAGGDDALDSDSDGVADACDCAPDDDTVYPGAPELCDGKDNACRGALPLDEHDLDGDGVAACAGDCADTDPLRFPGNAEVCDGIDNDCANGVDDGLATSDWFPDTDGDGFGNQHANARVGCSAPEGFVADNSDCDDQRADIAPDAVDTPDDDVDQDCSGLDAVTCFVDDDGDGFGTDAVATVIALDGTCDLAEKESALQTDCDDGDVDAFPGAAEQSGDGVDQDCNGADAVVCYMDADGDGYGTDAATEVIAADGACDPARNEATSADDCDDADGSVHPTALEICNGIDDDCDDLKDPVGGTIADTDMDGVCDDIDPCPADATDDTDEDGVCDGVDLCSGDDSTGDSDGDGLCDDIDLCAGQDSSGDADEDGACALDVDGTTAFDCDDADAEVFPGALELCDGKDNGCTGTLPDEDADGDGDGLSICGGDCDDTDESRSPELTEDCDGTDNDCDGVVPLTEVDADGDGYPACADCDDLDDERYSGAPERCNGLDDDCDGSVPADEVDVDGDGSRVCDGDCDDAQPLVRHDWPEVCGDGLDNDCDDEVDEGCLSDQDLDDAVAEALAEQEGCHCDTSRGGTWWLAVLLVPLVPRRRRHGVMS